MVKRDPTLDNTLIITKQGRITRYFIDDEWVPADRVLRLGIHLLVRKTHEPEVTILPLKPR